MRMGEVAPVEDAKDRRFQDGHKDHRIFGDGQDPSVVVGRRDDNFDHGCEDRADYLDGDADLPAGTVGTDAGLHG